MGWIGEIPMHYLSAFLYLCLRPSVRTSVLLSGSRDAARCNRQDSSLLLRSLLMTTIIIRKSTFPSWVSLRRYGRSRNPRFRIIAYSDFYLCLFSRVKRCIDWNDYSCLLTYIWRILSSRMLFRFSIVGRIAKIVYYTLQRYNIYN